MDGMPLQSTLQVFQIAVAVLTLIAVVFYLGRNSRKIEENAENIASLRAEVSSRIDEQAAMVYRHDKSLAVLEREVLGGKYTR